MHIHRFVSSIHMVRIFGVSALAFLPSAFLFAQETGTNPPPTQPPPAASPAATARDDGGTATAERVVVTANKREENIQEVPSSVSVINDVELDNLHATQLTD